MRNQQLIAAALLAFVLLASASSQATASTEAGQCPLKQLAQLNLRIDDSAVLVPVTLENREVWMVLDMAASQTTIAQSAVTELKLRTETLPSKDPLFYFGKTPATQLASLPALELGGVRFKKEKFIVKIADLGLAKEVVSIGEDFADTTCGSPLYMSP